ncbi:hypothetical protein Goshw_020653, partial [Gossypium schwendimanii]|nr:hypothetical protein [Gossypium schwendimanii]
GNNCHDNGSKHKNRGAQGKVGLVSSSRGERIVECSTQIENYFYAKGITDDAVKVNTPSMFLTNIEFLWWRDRTTDKRQCEIET